MKNSVLILLIYFMNSVLLAQNNTPTSQSNLDQKFGDFLSGVRYAEIFATPDLELEIRKSPDQFQVYLGVVRYLESMNFEDVGFTSKINGLKMGSECEKAIVLISYDERGSTISDFSVTFYSCLGEWWQFKSSSSMINNGFGTIAEKTLNKLRKMYSIKKSNYSAYSRRRLPSQKTIWNEEEIKNHLKGVSSDNIEGIYERTSESTLIARYKVGIIKEMEEYKMIYLGGAVYNRDWIEGELKSELSKTAIPSIFKLKWRMRNKSISEDPYATFEPGFMNIVWPNNDIELYIKLFPAHSDNVSVSSNVSTSGTGFALSSDGYIISNYHVIEGANNIKIRGIKGDFLKYYKAEVAIVDKNNDIAILKITDNDFTTLGQIPYTFNNNNIDVGNSVYALGYPLRATMGDEVKLTNGIISSKTGFQGDITAYQISVPLQPGSSGGPLINAKGEIVGIVNSKHTGAENASYAIKTNYLTNLIQSMNTIPKVSTVNLIETKGLSDQVKFVKEFIYILEIN